MFVKPFHDWYVREAMLEYIVMLHLLNRLGLGLRRILWYCAWLRKYLFDGASWVGVVIPVRVSIPVNFLLLAVGSQERSLDCQSHSELNLHRVLLVSLWIYMALESVIWWIKAQRRKRAPRSPFHPTKM